MAGRKGKRGQDSPGAQEGQGYWLPWDPWVVTILGISQTKDALKKERVSEAASEQAQQIINHGVLKKKVVVVVVNSEQEASTTNATPAEAGRMSNVGIQTGVNETLNPSEFRLRCSWLQLDQAGTKVVAESVAY